MGRRCDHPDAICPDVVEAEAAAELLPTVPGSALPREKAPRE
jgi:hypothetical protein